MKKIIVMILIVGTALAIKAQTVDEHKQAIKLLYDKMDSSLIKDVGTKGDTLRMVKMMQTQVKSFVEITKHYEAMIAILEKKKK